MHPQDAGSTFNSKPAHMKMINRKRELQVEDSYKPKSPRFIHQEHQKRKTYVALLEPQPPKSRRNICGKRFRRSVFPLILAPWLALKLQCLFKIQNAHLVQHTAWTHPCNTNHVHCARPLRGRRLIVMSQQLILQPVRRREFQCDFLSMRSQFSLLCMLCSQPDEPCLVHGQGWQARPGPWHILLNNSQLRSYSSRISAMTQEARV